MISSKQIADEIASLESLGNLARSFSRIASGRMVKKRKSVLSAREFLEAIEDIFDEVRRSHQKQVKQLAKRRGFKKGERITMLSHNGRKVAVLLSSNTGLYGDIVKDTFVKFIRDVRGGDREVVVVGNKGRAMFLESEPSRPYTFFDMPEREVKSDDLVEVIRHLVNYEEIQVYYGRFENVIVQTPTVFNVSAAIDVGKGSEGKKERRAYIFEPTLEKILMYFETEIFASLFEQAVNESQLAQSAARLVSMDQAGEKVREELKVMNLRKLKLRHIANNKKQQELMAGVMALGYY